MSSNMKDVSVSLREGAERLREAAEKLDDLDKARSLICVALEDVARAMRQIDHEQERRALRGRDLSLLEVAVLAQIKEACSAYEGAAWSSVIQDYGQVRGKRLAGVMGSLSKKGYICCYGLDEDATVELSDKET